MPQLTAWGAFDSSWIRASRRIIRCAGTIPHPDGPARLAADRRACGSPRWSQRLVARTPCGRDSRRPRENV